MHAKVLAAFCVFAGLVGPSWAAPDKTAACGEDTVGAWEYMPPSNPGRVNISRLSNGHLLIVWIVTPRDGSATTAGAWEGTCEGSRRHWRILFSTDPAAVGGEVTEEFEARGDTVRFWLLGPDGKRGQEGAARRIK
jgi:hypothetical protein